MIKNQQDLVDISLTVLQNRCNEHYLRNSGAEKVTSRVLRSVAALIDWTNADDIQIAREELSRRKQVDAIATLNKAMG